ncbi:Uncharacterised protein [Streptococcus pneumoniae]|nr:Uncharacterised protein [Streptococcus pneumoniae]
MATTTPEIIPMIGNAAAIIAPNEDINTACRVKNMGAKAPTIVKTTPKMTMKSFTGAGKELNSSATPFTIVAKV